MLFSQKIEEVKPRRGGNKNRIFLQHEAFETHTLQTEHLKSMNEELAFELFSLV